MKSDLNRPEVMAMMRDWGAEGYGIYAILKDIWKHYKAPVPLMALPGIAKRYDISEDKVNQIALCYALFHHDSEFYWYKEIPKES